MEFLFNEPYIKEEFSRSSSYTSRSSGNENRHGDHANLAIGECDEDMSLSADSEDSGGELLASASEETFGGEFTAPESFAPSQTSPSLDSRGLPKKLCLVCNDFASGLHYGIPSCEACKAFFKRTVQGNVEYSCSANEDCEITKRRRKACQACRYKKCLSVGMLKEGVRIDRVRGGRQKYKRVDPPNSTLQCPKISLEHKMMTELLTSIEPEKVLALPDKNLNEGQYKFLLSLSDLVDRELVALIGWAKLVPGFLDISLSDQMNILQSVWLDIFVLSVAHRSTPYRDVLIFSDDLSLTQEETILYDVPKEFDAVLRNVCKRVSSLSLTSEEYIYLKTILLFNPEATKVTNIELVQKKRDAMQEHLQELASRRGIIGVSRLCSLVFLVASLVHVHLLSKNFWLRIKQEAKIPLHKLLSEMLEFLRDS